MRSSALTLTLLVPVMLAGCGSGPDGGQAAESGDRELARRQATERKLEAVVEIARDLRDRSGGVQPPGEAEVVAALRERTAAGEDPLLDGWDRPLRYEIVDERDGRSLRTGFRVVSAGADGRFESGGGDDLQHAVIITETIRGN